MPVTGDFDKLDRLINRFGELASSSARQQLARNLAEEAVELVHQGFEESRDPYGNEWAELKSREGQTLRDNGTMEGSFHVADVATDSFRIAAGVWYAIVHQEGRVIETEGTVRVEKLMHIPGVGWRRSANIRKPMVFQMHGRTVFATRVTIPQRRMLPDAGDIPAGWVSAFDEVADEFLAEFFDK